MSSSANFELMPLTKARAFLYRFTKVQIFASTSSSSRQRRWWRHVRHDVVRQTRNFSCGQIKAAQCGAKSIRSDSIDEETFVKQLPGLVVMGVDSCSEGRGFESRYCILHGHYFTLICCKICDDVRLKRPKINDKRGRGWPIFSKKTPRICFTKVNSPIRK